MGGSGDWMGGYLGGWGEDGEAPELPALPTAPPLTHAGQGGRKVVEVIACPACGNVEGLKIRTSDGAAAWWACECGCAWKEPMTVGRAVVRLA